MTPLNATIPAVILFSAFLFPSCNEISDPGLMGGNQSPASVTGPTTVSSFSQPGFSTITNPTSINGGRGQTVPGGLSPAALDVQIFNQVNAYRASIGLPSLVSDPTLVAMARAHSQNMVARSKLSHDGFQQRFNQLTQVGFQKASENVAMNMKVADPAGVAVAGWKKSPGHHKNMTNPADSVTGVATAKSADGSYYFTQLFATRRN